MQDVNYRKQPVQCCLLAFTLLAAAYVSKIDLLNRKLTSTSELPSLGDDVK